MSAEWLVFRLEFRRAQRGSPTIFLRSRTGRGLLCLLSARCSLPSSLHQRHGPPSRRAGDFAGTVDIGNGRKMYLECRGSGSPTVFIVPGSRASVDEWTKNLPVYDDVAKFTRVCAYDRPGVMLADGSPSRSDPVPMPSIVGNSVADLHALVVAAKIATPFVIVGHSYGGLVVRLYAMTYPGDVDGMVLVDPLSEYLRSAETPRSGPGRKRYSMATSPRPSRSTPTSSGRTPMPVSTRCSRPRRSSRCRWSC